VAERVYALRQSKFDALILENNQVKVVILPNLGSKIISLINKKTGREFCCQQQGEWKIPVFGDLWENYNLSGFDEMVPSVLPGFYPEEPWVGTPLADHGEVWALPWEWSQHSENNVTLMVHGIRIPYILHKNLSLENNSLVFHYLIQNPTPFPMKFIWAYHPLVKVEPGCRIELNRPVDTVTFVYSAGTRQGSYFTQQKWPITSNGDDLSIMGDLLIKRAEKYYFNAKGIIERVKISFPDRENLAFSFPSAKVPYVGVWLNQGGWKNEYHLAIEPATGFLDRLDLAALSDSISIIPPHGSYEWYLQIEVEY